MFHIMFIVEIFTEQECFPNGNLTIMKVLEIATTRRSHDDFHSKNKSCLLHISDSRIIIAAIIALDLVNSDRPRLLFPNQRPTGLIFGNPRFEEVFLLA